MNTTLRHGESTIVMLIQHSVMLTLKQVQGDQGFSICWFQHLLVSVWCQILKQVQDDSWIVQDDRWFQHQGNNKEESMKQYYVYIMTNYSRRSLYIGMTNDLVLRVAEHKAHVNKGFTAKYDCKVLVYYEEFPSAEQAIAREKQLKNWHREWKVNLIKEQNPALEDLSEVIGVTQEIVDGIREQYAATGRR